MGLQVTVRSPASSGLPHTVVELAGEADLNDSAALRDLIAAESGGLTAPLVLDLSRLRFMDSAILQVILVAARSMAPNGVLALADPAEAVLRILSLTGADQLIAVYGSVDEALQHV